MVLSLFQAPGRKVSTQSGPLLSLCPCIAPCSMGTHVSTLRGCGQGIWRHQSQTLQGPGVMSTQHQKMSFHRNVSQINQSYPSYFWSWCYITSVLAKTDFKKVASKSNFIVLVPYREVFSRFLLAHICQILELLPA